jgi:hypothetical protein
MAKKGIHREIIRQAAKEWRKRHPIKKARTVRFGRPFRKPKPVVWGSKLKRKR